LKIGRLLWPLVVVKTIGVEDEFMNLLIKGGLLI
jgi:hypothetical protein